MSGTLTVAVYNEREKWSLPTPVVERLRGVCGDDLPLRQVTRTEELLEALPETRALIGLPITDEQFADAGAHIEWVQLTTSIGARYPSIGERVGNGLRLSTAAGIRAPFIAEHALALALSLTRLLPDALRAQREHVWAIDRISHAMRTLVGARVGVLAHGSVARAIAGRFRACESYVIGSGVCGDCPGDAFNEVVPTSELASMLARADIVVVALPKIARTNRIIDRAVIKKMRKTAVVIDVSRGGIVDEEALIDALRRGRIAGAALDVFETEPLPPSSPLWTLQNVLITPHVAAASPTYWSRAADIFATNIERWRAGEPLLDEAPSEWFRKES